MDHGQHTAIVNFIWGIADDVLRDVFVRGKYRDVILPMTVIRRLDSLLEPTHDEVLATKRMLDTAGITELELPLRQAAGQPFYNTSDFTLRKLTNFPKNLAPNTAAYLDGFSPNVREILEKFDFRNQLPKLAQADALGPLLEKFLDPRINLSPNPVLDGQGNPKLPGLDNHGMGTIFEELIRRFNEENNEEAGEHFTPRDVVRLMADLIFLPIAAAITDSTYLVYDGACGTGGMLTVAEERLRELADASGKEVSIHLYGQEINPETFAITKADLLLKGEGAEADNMAFGSTLAADAFPGTKFDFMLSNPPYGKSWKTDLERLGGKEGMKDPRFVVAHAGDPEYSLVTRTSDGQMLFLANMLAKMKPNTPLGSRIAEVHNGSALFTGDAGQGESNIRRWIIEHDWLEAIVALPLNIFYNTGIATYIWVLTNRKPVHRRGFVQLIDATAWFKPLRRNLGNKNCELAPEDIERLTAAFLAFEETEQSKIFPNEAFGYRKVTVERPLRLRVSLTPERIARLRDAGSDPGLVTLVEAIVAEFGPGPFLDYMQVAKTLGPKLKGKREKLFREFFCERNEEAAPIIAKYLGDATGWELDLLDPEERLAGVGIGFWRIPLGAIGQAPFPVKVRYEPDPELRDTEQIPLLEPEGIAGFIAREVWPYAPDAWVDDSATRTGYEISFTRYFYKPKPLRTLSEIEADIRALEAETEGLLDEILIGVEEHHESR